MGGKGEKEPIKNPVTAGMLEKVVEAGYGDILQDCIGLVATELSDTQKAQLVRTADSKRAKRLYEESRTLYNLAELSDDPRWQERFMPQATALEKEVHRIHQKNFEEALTTHNR